MGFKVGQKVVYPNHGIGTIEQIEQKQIGANSLPFYTLRLAARVAAENDPKSDEKLRDPDEAATRTLLRRLAEEAKTPIEFKPCQNVVDYQLSLKNLVREKLVRL